MDVSAQEEKEFAFPPLFCSLLALNGMDDASPHRWGWIFFIQSTESNANPFWKYPQQTYPEIPFYQPAGHPLAQSSWLVKWTFTDGLTVVQSPSGMMSLHFLTTPSFPNFNLWTPFPWTLGPRSRCSTYLSIFCILPWLIFSFSLPLQSQHLAWVMTLHHPFSPREPPLLQVLEGRTPPKPGSSWLQRQDPPIHETVMRRSFLRNASGEFLGGLVVRTLHSHCQGPGFDPWLRH